MPLYLKKNLEPEGVIGVWRNDEPESYFEQRMNLFPEEVLELSKLKNRKKMEWLSSRHLLHLLSERALRGACLKDKYGKPYLVDSDFHISMSHTGDYTAVVGSPYVVGIDIQVIVSKIEGISSKFVSEKEFVHVHPDKRLESLHAIWGAKESMYKAYGRRELDFRKNIFVHEFEYSDNGFIFEGEVKKDEFHENYTLFCQQLNDLILVYAIQK